MRTNGAAPLVIADTVDALERRLVACRKSAPGSHDELVVLVELATRLIRDPRRRADLAKEGLALARRLGDRVRSARCRAVAAEVSGRHGHALDVLPEALAVVELCASLGDDLASAQAHHAAAWVYCMLNCPTEVLEHGRTALDRYRVAGDRFGEGRMLSVMAQVFEDIGDPSTAEGFLQEAYDLFVECNDPVGEAVTLADLAQTHRLAGRPIQAAEECERALRLFGQLGDPIDAVQAMVALAHVRADGGSVDEATSWARRAVVRTRSRDGVLESAMLRFDALLVLAKCLQLDAQDLDGAQTALEEALALAALNNWPSRLAAAENDLAAVLHQRGDLQAAYTHLVHHCELARDVAQQNQDRRVQALQVGFRVEVARREAELLREQARRHEATIEELRRTRSELSRRMAELEAMHAEAVKLNQRDALTGLYSRRHTYELLEPMFAAAVAGGEPLSVGVVDVDDFKRINDEFGHDVGDIVLCIIARHIERALTVPQFGARIGGDELLLVLVGPFPSEATLACERLRVSIADHPWDAIAPGLRVSVSIGVTGHESGASLNEVLKASDAAMYRAKRTGKDRVST